MSRRIFCFFFLVACWALTSVALAQEAIRDPKIYDLYPSSTGRGEVAFLNTSGEVQIRVRGFDKLSALALVRPNQILLVDEGRREVVLLDTASTPPAVIRTWALPQDLSAITEVIPLSGDRVAILDRSKGPIRLGSDSTPVLLSSASLPSRYDSMALLPNGRIVVVGERGEGGETAYLYVDVDAWQSASAELSPSLEKDGKPIRVRFMTSAQGVYTFEPASHDVCQVSVTGNILSRSGCFRLPHAPALLLQDSPDSFVSLVPHGFLSRYSVSEPHEKQISLEFLPSLMVFEPGRGLLAVGHQRQQETHWPDPKLYGKDPGLSTNWGKVSLWTIISFVLTFALFRILGGRRELHAGDPTSSLTPRSTGEPTTPPSFLIVGGILIAVEVARRAQSQLFLSDQLAVWGMWYAGGALLFAIMTKWWYRMAQCESPALFAGSIPVQGIRMPRGFTTVLSLVLLLLGWLIIETRNAEGLLTYKGCLWFSSLAIVIAWLCLDISNHRAAVGRALRAEWFLLAFPLLVGSVTFLFHLTTLPINTHFDFSIPGLWAWQIATGRVIDIWRIGYTPVPVFGLLPDILGMLAFGGTPIGYRIGPALFGLFGLVAVYIIGREYRGPWVGFWAALFLAGNVPYIHFSRMSTCGTATTSMFWVLAFFVLAWRLNWSSLWMMTGITAGFSMYQWPVARVGMAAIVVTVALVTLRHPRLVFGRWRGYLLGLVGFAVMLAPIIWGWRVYPGLIFPRAGSIDPIASPYPGILGFLHSTFGPQFFRCFGWFFFEADHSSQGSMSPGLNQFEGVLCALGLALFLFSRCSINLLLGVLLLITLVICGSYTRTAWYTRLLPIVVVSAVACAQALEIFHVAFRNYGKRIGRFATVALTALVTIGSPFVNLKSYMKYESGYGRVDLMEPMVALGQKIYDMGPGYKYGLVVIGSSTWSIKASHPRMLPFIMDREIHDFVELDSGVLDQIREPYVFFVQARRVDKDSPRILRKFPDAKVENIVDLRGKLIAQAITVNSPK